MKKIAIIGFRGKMGSVVFDLLSQKYKVVGIDKSMSINLAKYSDLVIDFSSAENSVIVAKWCAHNKIPLIIGSTGQSEKELSEIDVCTKNVPIMKAANFSLGVLFLKKMLKQLEYCEFEDISIIESHHKNKKDAPSGTAIDLKLFLNKLFLNEVKTYSLRGGEEVGTHKINLYFGSELLSIEHKAFSRKAFARGVAVAAEFMMNVNENKLYSFEVI